MFSWIFRSPIISTSNLSVMFKQKWIPQRRWDAFMLKEKPTHSYMGTPGYLHPGSVHPEHFRLLVGISNIYSERIRIALELFLVRGLTRQESCDEAGISQSCLSIKLRQIQSISRAVTEMHPWYTEMQKAE
ncbi:transcriptional regulator [Citrobacter freundii]|nr:transcriptional regulator [Citrobacter freundii]